jgi:hypothetical protein
MKANPEADHGTPLCDHGFGRIHQRSANPLSTTLEQDIEVVDFRNATRPEDRVPAFPENRKVSGNHAIPFRYQNSPVTRLLFPQVLPEPGRRLVPSHLGKCALEGCGIGLFERSQLYC